MLSRHKSYFYIADTRWINTSASTLGSLLLIFSLLIFIIQYVWIGNRSYVTVSGKSYRGETYKNYPMESNIALSSC